MGPAEPLRPAEPWQTWAVLYARDAARYATQTAQDAQEARLPVYAFTPAAILALEARACAARLALESHVAESLKWRREPADPEYWTRFLTFAEAAVLTAEHQTD